MLSIEPNGICEYIETVNILGIDPGTDTIGFSIIEVEIDTLKVIKALAWTETISRYVDEEDLQVVIHNPKFTRLNIIADKLKLIFEIFNPIVVACEAPFYNRLKPSAYAPLVETVFVINKAIHTWDSYKPLYVIDPPSVKIAVGAKSRADKSKGEDNKDIVKKAISSIEELKSLNFDLLDSHSTDACAVAYCQLSRLRESLK